MVLLKYYKNYLFIFEYLKPTIYYNSSIHPDYLTKLVRTIKEEFYINKETNENFHNNYIGDGNKSELEQGLKTITGIFNIDIDTINGDKVLLFSINEQIYIRINKEEQDTLPPVNNQSNSANEITLTAQSFTEDTIFNTVPNILKRDDMSTFTKMNKVLVNGPRVNTSQVNIFSSKEYYNQTCTEFIYKIRAYVVNRKNAKSWIESDRTSESFKRGEIVKNESVNNPVSTNKLLRLASTDTNLNVVHLAKGAGGLDVQDKNGYTVLHHAHVWRQKDLIEQLINAGASTQIKTTKSRKLGPDNKQWGTGWTVEEEQAQEQKEEQEEEQEEGQKEEQEEEQEQEQEQGTDDPDFCGDCKFLDEDNSLYKYITTLDNKLINIIIRYKLQHLVAYKKVPYKHTIYNINTRANSKEIFDSLNEPDDFISNIHKSINICCNKVEIVKSYLILQINNLKSPSTEQQKTDKNKVFEQYNKINQLENDMLNIKNSISLNNYIAEQYIKKKRN